MARLLGFLSVLVFSCACGAPASSVRFEPATAETRGAAVGLISCDEGRTRMLTPAVRARRDGIHLRFLNTVGAVEFYMRATDHPVDNHGGPLRGRLVKDVSSHAPGPMWVLCMSRGEEHPNFYAHDPRYARFEIVDPNHLWVPFEPECDDVEKLNDRRLQDANTLEDVERWVRDHFDIDVGERIRPGYPLTQWKGDPWVIVHEDRTLAYFHASEADRGWMLHRARGCR